MASDERAVLDAVPKALLIGGEWREASSGARLTVEDPSTAEPLCEVADAGAADALAALSAADGVQPAWAACPPRERSEILRRSYDAIVRRVDELALLMTLEMGKALSESRAEVLYAADFLRWFGEEAVRIDGRYTLAPNGQSRLFVLRQPVGPCVLITPWNFPMAMGTRKIGPAIAAGCTMVVKPAQQTPLSMLMLARILGEAGLPGGVLNVITASRASEVVEPLLRDARTRKVSFTGSTKVGKLIATQAAQNLLRVSLELGGNAPFVVFDDADIDAAIEGAMIAKHRNIGQACTAANRFHVSERLAAQFTERLASRTESLRVGRGTEPDVQVGPLIDEAGRRKVTELVGDALQRGASAVTGGRAIEGRGYFYQPTVLADVPREARLLKEEIFGPVAPVRGFSDEDEAIA
ncbi:MAG TPA: NAD-dependent succinate-semialdehyde dehydrogenase, partial [Candidatus Sulfotelmatobacter sp.]|nr:NAD-dependent succinate-semialdehyde dehydrogenase [Candidatus Sulfotelmatobacter sp.]